MFVHQMRVTPQEVRNKKSQARKEKKKKKQNLGFHLYSPVQQFRSEGSKLCRIKHSENVLSRNRKLSRWKVAQTAYLV